MNSTLKRLLEIKNQLEDLYAEQQELLKTAPEQIVEQNEDGTWTRFNKVDNLKTLEAEGQFFKATSVTRYGADIRVLKNKPKED